MNKYQKAMEHIYVDRDMYNRILNAIPKAVAMKARKRIGRMILAMGGITAASVILVWSLRGPYHIPWENSYEESPASEDTDKNSTSNYDYSITEYSSVKELSEAVEFQVREFTHMPFETDKILYQAYAKEAAEIIYTHNGQDLYYRKAKRGFHIFENDNEYEQTKEIQIHSNTITLKGDSREFYLAVWADENYSYAVGDSGGLDEKILLQLVADIYKQ